MSLTSEPQMQANVGYQTHQFLVLTHDFNQLTRLSNLPHTHTVTGVDAGGDGEVLFKFPSAFVPVKGDINTRSSFGLRLSSKRLISPDPFNPPGETAGLGASRDEGLRGQPLE